MSTEDNHKQALWQEAQEHGGAYKPRDRRKVKGAAARNTRYHSPYRRAFDAYKDTPERTLPSQSSSFNGYQRSGNQEGVHRRVREMNARLDPICRTVWAAYKATHIVHLGKGIFWNDDIHWRSPSVDAERGRKAGDDLYDLATVMKSERPMGCQISRHRGNLHQHLKLILKVAVDGSIIVKGDLCALSQFYHSQKSGGTCQIWAPNRELKSKQRWILRNIWILCPFTGLHMVLWQAAYWNQCECACGFRGCGEHRSRELFPHLPSVVSKVA